MRLLKALTLLLAASSVIALIVASRATPRPLTAIAAVQPAMNFGYVRVEGVVTAYPTLSERDKFLSFRVWDASGELRVTAYRAVVERLLAERRIPLPGDRVSVEGTLRIRDDEPSLILNAAEGLSVETPPAATINLAALDGKALGERVQAAGQVRRIRNAGDRLRIVSVRDGDATADVVLSLALPAFVTAPQLRVGEWISVTGAVGEYRGAKQVLASRVDIVQEGTMPAAGHFRSIAELDDRLLGRWVGVEGVVSDLRPFKQGMRVEVTDASGASIVVVMFDSVWQNLPFSTTLSVDDRIHVEGELAEYRGQIELLPELPVDVKLTGVP
ncbi:MAG: OB-fold nucleic acid binding domain-containing protein [Candidatus Brachytrichaceae bacterium NZ_4S206]|jgi:DNA/RNA endonuclease YhcR with UshA esterase domain